MGAVGLAGLTGAATGSAAVADVAASGAVAGSSSVGDAEVVELDAVESMSAESSGSHEDAAVLRCRLSSNDAAGWVRTRLGVAAGLASSSARARGGDSA